MLSFKQRIGLELMKVGGHTMERVRLGDEKGFVKAGIAAVGCAVYVAGLRLAVSTATAPRSSYAQAPVEAA